MAASLTQGNQSTWLGAATSRGQSFTSNPTPGNVLFCVVFLGSTGITPTVDDNADASNVWTRDALTTTSGGSMGLFRLSTVSTLPTSATTITGHFTSSVQAVSLFEVAGITNAAPEKTNPNSGSSASPSTGALGALAETGCFLVGLFLLGSAQTFTLGTDGQGGSMSQIAASTNGQGRTAGMEYEIAPGSLSYNLDATWGGSAAWSAIAAAYPPISTPAAPVLPVFKPIPFYPLPSLPS